MSPLQWALLSSKDANLGELGSVCPGLKPDLPLPGRVALNKLLTSLCASVSALVQQMIKTECSLEDHWEDQVRSPVEKPLAQPPPGSKHLIHISCYSYFIIVLVFTLGFLASLPHTVHGSNPSHVTVLS